MRVVRVRVRVRLRGGVRLRWVDELAEGDGRREPVQVNDLGVDVGSERAIGFPTAQALRTRMSIWGRNIDKS